MTSKQTDTIAAHAATARSLGGEAMEIAQLIEEQVGLYEELDALSERQHAIIGDDDTDALLRVLGDREKVIAKITAVSARLSPYQAQWNEHIAMLADTERDRLRSRLASVEGIMDRISQRDESDRAVMQRRRDQLGEQLTGVRRSGAAMAAYGKPPAKGPRFQDREA